MRHLVSETWCLLNLRPGECRNPFQGILTCQQFFFHHRPPPKYRVIFSPPNLENGIHNHPSTNGREIYQNGGVNAPSADEPYYASILSNERVTAPDHFQDVRLIKFDVHGSDIRWVYSSNNNKDNTNDNTNNNCDNNNDDGDNNDHDHHHNKGTVSIIQKSYLLITLCKVRTQVI